MSSQKVQLTITYVNKDEIWSWQQGVIHRLQCCCWEQSWQILCVRTVVCSRVFRWLLSADNVWHTILWRNRLLSTLDIEPLHHFWLVIHRYSVFTLSWGSVGMDVSHQNSLKRSYNLVPVSGAIYWVQTSRQRYLTKKVQTQFWLVLCIRCSLIEHAIVLFIITCPIFY